MLLDQSSETCASPNNCRMDEHWRPLTSICHFCDINYKIVTKAENLVEEQQFLGILANATIPSINKNKSSGDKGWQVNSSSHSYFDNFLRI